MGVLNRTPDSFYDKGRFFELSDCIDRGAALVADGADIIDIGGVKAGPGPEVDAEEELERVVPVVEALTMRFDIPISIDTFRAEVAAACFAVGAVCGNDISGFADPGYLPAAASAGATVVATHIRLRPRVADPDPRYPDDNVVAAVRAFLADRREQALLAGLAPNQIVLDAGLDLGKSATQSIELLRASAKLAALGQPLLLSASNKSFLGAVLDLPIDERRDASLAAAALAYTLGCRIFRVHDVAGTRQVLDVLEPVLAR
jgi:dihydropteroate synthase